MIFLLFLIAFFVCAPSAQKIRQKEGTKQTKIKHGHNFYTLIT